MPFRARRSDQRVSVSAFLPRGELRPEANCGGPGGGAGTPLLGAGLPAASGARHVRRRVAGDSAERRVWQAGRTPFHPRLGGPPDGGGDGGREASPLALPAHRDGPGSAGAGAAGASRAASGSPMTETARRIMMALDAMTEVSCD
jgi:hypothetical protein